jgi:hypothetical protein
MEPPKNSGANLRNTRNARNAHNPHKKCPQGYGTRKSYIRKTGVSVREACVPLHVERASNTRRLGEHKRCPEGDIPKASYMRKGANGSPPVYVPPTCIRAPSRIGILRRGDLKKYGYRYDLPEKQRQEALVKAMKKYGILETFHKLNAIANISESTHKVPAERFREDATWVLGIYNKQKEGLK